MVCPVDTEFGTGVVISGKNADVVKNNVGKKAKSLSIDQTKGVDFEDALAATGYGKFNIFLLLCMLPAYISTVSVSSSVTFIFTKAKCDLNLSLVDMGTINAMTYTGMISSSLLWGFISDTLGRKRIVVWGYLGAACFDLCAGFSQNFTMLLITRFLAGFIMNGPFVVSVSYIAELHKADIRAKVILYTSCFYTLANTLLPLFAWFMLPHTWNFAFFNGFIVLRSWNLFLISIASMPLTAGLAFSFIPESPKFLLSRGRNDEALKVLQNIYKMNTGKDESEFPVKFLIAEQKEESARGFQALKAGFSQLAPLFGKPYVCYLILLCFINLSCMLGHNTIRLWFPQLAAMLEAGEGRGLCLALTQNLSSTDPDVLEECLPLDVGGSTYLQNAGVGATSALAYIIGGMLINAMGKKRLAVVCFAICAVAVGLIPFLGAGEVAESFTVVMVALIISMSSLANVALSSITVDLFPTALRVTAMAMFFMFGRMGTISGNVAFPTLLQFGCFAPFVAIGFVLAAGCIASAFIPQKNVSPEKL